MRFSTGWLVHLLDWCDAVDAELERWSSTAGVGMSPSIRRLLDRTRDLHRDAVAKADGHEAEDAR